MASFNLTHETHSDSVFVLAGRLAHSAADVEAIRNEEDLERLYHLRMARRIAAHASSLDSLKLRQIVGWS